MDSRGNFYTSTATREALEAEAGRALDVRPVSQLPKDAIPIADGYVAGRLALLNRRGRKVFYAERRRNVSEVDALAAAEASYR